MKKIIYLLFIILMIVGCTSKNEQGIVLFNDITFDINDGEKIVHIDSTNKAIFNSYLNETHIQVPLFRCVQAKDYLILLGIPINTSIKKLADYNLANTKNQSLFESDSTNYFYLNHQNKDDRLVVYSKAFDNNLIYILTVSNSIELSDSLFSKNALSKRFNK